MFTPRTHTRAPAVSRFNLPLAAAGCGRRPSGKYLQKDCGKSPPAGCADRDVRVSFNVNPETGNISNFTKWKQYDPRQRPWFKHAVAQWEEQQGKHAWSSIYPFAANGKLGASKLSNRVSNIRSCVHARERIAAQTRRNVSPAVHSSFAQRCTHKTTKLNVSKERLA